MANLSLGILGSASIVRRAIFQPLPFVEGIQVTGIANRTRARAEALAAEFGVSRVWERLDDALASPDIDAVYLALSNDLHAEWALRAAEAGKHVLVEKPIALHNAECARLEPLADQAVVVLEGLMVQHHPWQVALRALLQSGKYGKLLGIRTELHTPLRELPPTSYRCDPRRGGGVFADLGCYWLQTLQVLLGIAPCQIKAHTAESAFDGPQGCDWSITAALFYTDGLQAELSASYERPYRTRHVLTTEAAVVTVNDFFRANVGRYKMTIKVEEHGTGRLLDSIRFEPQHYYENQLRYFRDLIFMGNGSSEGLRAALERVRLQEQIYAGALRSKHPSEAWTQ